MEYTVVIPVYNELNSLTELSDRILAVFQSMHKQNNFEILFVDDGSTDGSREKLGELSRQRGHIRVVFLRRNFGKSFALSAGFIHAQGNFVITMDGDLQDRPEEIPRLIAKMAEGYDLVSGWKQRRRDGLLRMILSRIFNLFVSKSFGVHLHDFNCGLKIFKKAVVKNIAIYGQHHRFIPILAHLLGFKVSEVSVIHDQREYGVSRYPVFRYQGLFDLFSLVFIHRFRFSPLYFFGTVGLSLILPSLLIIGTFSIRILLWMAGIMSRPEILFNRPILALSTAALIMGLHIFLTGFVCDFILHHQSKKMVVESIEAMIDDSI